MISPELKALFYEPYVESQRIDETFARIRNEEGLKAAIEYLLSIGAKYLDVKSYETLHHLDQFTKNNIPLYERIALVESLADGKEIKSVTVEYNDKKQRLEIILDTHVGKFRAMRFSEVCPQMLEILPELETDGRMGQCFYLAYEIMRHLSNRCEVVTGYTFGYTDKSKFLHSWVEIKLRGKTYVIDGTNNLLIDKEGYYTIRHAVPITKISRKTFESDIKNHKDIVEGIDLPVYLLFRDEIIAGRELAPSKFDIQEEVFKKI